jgi:hypothetical protein
MSVAQLSGNITATVANIDGAVNGSTLVLSPSEAADSSITWAWDLTSSISPAYIPRR